MQAPAELRLVLVPGLGADARLFDMQREAFPDLFVPPWIEPKPREPLPDYAARMAGALAEVGRPRVLGGASFGGMLALEMARILRPRALALIGSAYSGREVARWLRLVERVGHPLPTPVIDAARTLTPLVAPIVSSASRINLALFLDMLRNTPTPFLRWAGGAIRRWRFEGSLPCPVHRLHGSADFIIRPPPSDGVRWIEGGGHVLSMSHPEETNEFLRGALEQAAPETVR